MKSTLGYAERGWFVFPVTKGKSKPPLITGWQEKSSADPHCINQWKKQFPGCNWGLDCEKSGLCVIDVDNKNGKPGDDSFLDLELDHGLPPTFTVKTPNGGFHHYYSGLTASTAGKLGPGIDTKSIGGYVVIPESKRSTGIYEIVRHCDQIPPLPTSLKNQISLPLQKDPERDIPAVELDQPHNVIKATHYLVNNAKPSLQESGGDDNAYKTACHVRDLGVSEDVAIDLLDRFWNPRCEPPWSYEELQVKIKNAYRYSQNKAGVSTPEADFKPIEQNAEKNAQFETFAEAENLPGPKKISLYTQKPPERVWLIENWIPEGEISALYGDGGIGKSLIALQLAASVASGAPFLGLNISRSVPVLAVMAEDKDDELHRRIYSICSSPGYDFSDVEQTELYLWSVAGHSSVLAQVDQGTAKKMAFYDQLDKELSKLQTGHKLLILDTLSDVFAGNENDRQSASRFIKVVLHSLITKHNLTILLLAHPSLTGQNTGTFLSGSTAWNNSVRNRLILRPHNDDTLKDKYRVLECVKSNYAKPGEALMIYWENGVYRSIESDDPVIDEIINVNKDIVYQAIVSWSKLGKPIGLRSNAATFIGKIPMFMHNGLSMSTEKKKECVNELIAEGRVNDVKGERAGKNGLYPKLDENEENVQKTDENEQQQETNCTA
jgi:RecA-family ATPase